MDETRTIKVGAVAEAAGLTVLNAVRASTPAPEAARVLAGHLDPDQVATLHARTEALGPVAHYLLDETTHLTHQKPGRPGATRRVAGSRVPASARGSRRDCGE